MDIFVQLLKELLLEPRANEGQGSSLQNRVTCIMKILSWTFIITFNRSLLLQLDGEAHGLELKLKFGPFPYKILKYLVKYYII